MVVLWWRCLFFYKHLFLKILSELNFQTLKKQDEPSLRPLGGIYCVLLVSVIQYFTVKKAT